MIALVDVASNVVAGWRLCQSENATDTVQLIRSTCEAFGIFDTLYTDNGSALAGHLVAGGNPHKFRNAGPRPFSRRASASIWAALLHKAGWGIHLVNPVW
jgi:putative transposase